MESNMETKPYCINDNEATIVTYNEERLRVNVPTKDILNVSSCRSNNKGGTSKSAKKGSASVATKVVHDVLSKPEAENNEPTTKKIESKIVNETNVCGTYASTVIFTEIIEISGIVEQLDEDLLKKVFLETAKVGVVLDANDIEYVIRVGNRNFDNNCPRPVVLKFRRQCLNNIVINAVKQHDSLYKSEDFILDGNTIIPSDVNKKGCKDDIICIPNIKSEGINESLELHKIIKDHTQCNSNKKQEPMILEKKNILNTNKSWSKKESALLNHTGKTKDTNEISQEEENKDTKKLEESASILKTKENSTVAGQNLSKKKDKVFIFGSSENLKLLKTGTKINNNEKSNKFKAPSLRKDENITHNNKPKNDKKEPPFSKDTNEIEDTNQISQTQCSEKEVMDLKESATKGNKRVTDLQSDRSKVFSIPLENWDNSKSMPLEEKSQKVLTLQKIEFEEIIGGARRKEVITTLETNNKIVTTPLVDHGKQVLISQNYAFDKMIDENKRKENPISVSNQSKIVPILQSDHTLVISPQKDELYEVIDGGKEKDTTISTTPLVGKSKEAQTPQKVVFEGIIGGATRKEVCTPLENNTKIVTAPLVDLGKQVLISRNDAFDKIIVENKKKENPISVSNQNKIVPILQSYHTLFISPQKDELYEVIDGGKEKDTTISTESSTKQVSNNKGGTSKSAKKGSASLATEVVHNMLSKPEAENNEPTTKKIESTIVNETNVCGTYASTVIFTEIIEISGIVEQLDEDLLKKVFLETAKVGVVLDANDIEYVIRVGNRNFDNNCPRPIVLKFRRQCLNNIVINAVKQHESLYKLEDFILDGNTIIPSDVNKKGSKDDIKCIPNKKSEGINESLELHKIIKYHTQPNIVECNSNKNQESMILEKQNILNTNKSWSKKESALLSHTGKTKDTNEICQKEGNKDTKKLEESASILKTKENSTVAGQNLTITCLESVSNTGILSLINSKQPATALKKDRYSFDWTNIATSLQHNGRKDVSVTLDSWDNDKSKSKSKKTDKVFIFGSSENLKLLNTGTKVNNIENSNKFKEPSLRKDENITHTNKPKNDKKEPPFSKDTNEIEDTNQISQTQCSEKEVMDLKESATKGNKRVTDLQSDRSKVFSIPLENRYNSKSMPLEKKNKEVLTLQKIEFEGIIGGARRKEVITMLETNNKIVTTPLVDHGKQVLISQNYAFDKMIDKNKRKENPISVSNQSKMVPILLSDHTLVISPQKDELYEVIYGGKEKNTTISTTPLVRKSKEALTPQNVVLEGIIGGATRKEVCTPLENNTIIVTTPLVDLGKQVLISRNDAFDKIIDENMKKENPISVSNHSKIVPNSQTDDTKLFTTPQKDKLYQVIDKDKEKDITISTESSSKEILTPLVKKSKEILTPQKDGLVGIIGGARRKEVITTLETNNKIVTTPLVDHEKQVLTSWNDAFDKMIEENKKKENPISVSNHSEIVPNSQTDDTKLFTTPQKDKLYQVIDEDKEKDITISTESSSKEILTPLVKKSKEILTPQKDGLEGIIGGARRKEVITTLETNNKIVTTPLIDHGKHVLTSWNDAFDKMIDDNKKKENPISVSNHNKIVPNSQTDDTKLFTTPQKDKLYQVIDEDKEKDITISTESSSKEILTPLVKKSKEILTPQKDGFEGIIGGGARRKEVITMLETNNKIVTTPLIDHGKHVLTSWNDAFDKMIDDNKKKENPISVSNHNKIVPNSQTDDTKLFTTPQKDKLYQVIDEDKEKDITISTESSSKEILTPLVKKSKEILTPQKDGLEGIIGGARRKEVITTLETNNKIVTTPLIDHGKHVLTSWNDAFDKMIDENKKKENPISVSNHNKIVPNSQTDDTKLFTTPQKDKLYQVIDEDKEKDITISTESSSKEILTPLVKKSKEILTPQKDGLQGIIGGARRKEVITTLETIKKIVTTPLVDDGKQMLTSWNDAFDKMIDENKKKENPISVSNHSKIVPNSQTDDTKLFTTPQKDKLYQVINEDKEKDITISTESSSKEILTPLVKKSKEILTPQKVGFEGIIGGGARRKEVITSLKTNNKIVTTPLVDHRKVLISQNDGFDGNKRKENQSKIVAKSQTENTKVVIQQNYEAAAESDKANDVTVRIGSKLGMSQQEIGRDVNTPIGDNEEPDCAICQAPCQNKAHPDICRHFFCFICLSTWSQVKPECPLCKRPFKSIIYNIRAGNQHDKYHLNQNNTEVTAEGNRFSSTPEPSLPSFRDGSTLQSRRNLGRLFETPPTQPLRRPTPEPSPPSFLDRRSLQSTRIPEPLPSQTLHRDVVDDRSPTYSHWVVQSHTPSRPQSPPIYFPTRARLLAPQKQSQYFPPLPTYSANSFGCDVCGRVCASKAGLMSHQRMHARNGETASWRGRKGTYGLPDDYDY